MTEIKKSQINIDKAKEGLALSYEVVKLEQDICVERIWALTDSTSKRELATIYGHIKAGVESCEYQLRSLEEEFEKLLNQVKRKQIELINGQLTPIEQIELESKLIEVVGILYDLGALRSFVYSHEQELLKANQSGVLKVISESLEGVPKEVLPALLSKSLAKLLTANESLEEPAEAPGAPNLKP